MKNSSIYELTSVDESYKKHVIQFAQSWKIYVKIRSRPAGHNLDHKFTTLLKKPREQIPEITYPFEL